MPMMIGMMVCMVVVMCAEVHSVLLYSREFLYAFWPSVSIDF